MNILLTTVTTSENVRLCTLLYLIVHDYGQDRPSTSAGRTAERHCAFHEEALRRLRQTEDQLQQQRIENDALVASSGWPQFVC